MRLKTCICFLIGFEICFETFALKFEEITNEIFPNDSGIIAAFGHFNKDEYTDIFFLQQGGTKLQLFLGNGNGEQFQTQLNCSYRSFITSVVPGDFNGDSLMDILITLSTEQLVNEVKILWGSNNSVNCKSDTVFSIKNQPLVVDFNGDMIPDVFGESKSGERYVWISSKDGKFANRSLSHLVSQKFRNPHSSGLLDLNNDFASDILVTGEENIEVWYNIGENGIKSQYSAEEKFLRNYSIPYPISNSSNHVYTLQSSFVDINLDGKLDLVLPVCYDSKCKLSAVLVWNSNTSTWQTLLHDFKYQNTTWGFKPPMGSIFDMAALPVTLRFGDIDMDGYPDFITILQSKVNMSDVRAVILRNVPCHDCSNCTSHRCLQILWEIPGLKDISDIHIAAFFDIFEDGILDILVSSKSNEEWKLHALRNSDTLDSCFMKVLVLNGLCSNCSKELSAYGVNQPGPIVRYNMTKQDGQPLVSSSVQISQSAHFPLQLPYSLFGLGPTPNFIDVLLVSIPANFSEFVHKREWTQIIPNSQMVVIPHPPSDESKWVKKLFVTPSHNVVLTCISLIGTCTFISILVALLHWKERKEDKKEKMQDAYRFHFDAM